MKYSSLLVAAPFLLLLSGCGSSKQEKAPPIVSNAIIQPNVPLPSAPLGLYVSYYLAGGNVQAVAAALSGVSAQGKLHTPYNPMTSDDTFALLEEFGNVLQVDVPDLLNRSSNRALTLTQYQEGLSNITTRAKRTAQDLTDHQKQLSKDERDARTESSGIQRQLQKALKDNDYGTAGTLQKQLTASDTSVGKILAEQNETRSTLNTFQKLIDIADQRLDAMTKNREVLIAGLKVVDVPGVDSLDLISNSQRKKYSF